VNVSSFLGACSSLKDTWKLSQKLQWISLVRWWMHRIASARCSWNTWSNHIVRMYRFASSGKRSFSSYHMSELCGSFQIHIQGKHIMFVVFLRCYAMHFGFLRIFWLLLTVPLYPEDTVSIFWNMLVPICDTTDFTWHKTMIFILTAVRMSDLMEMYSHGSG